METLPLGSGTTKSIETLKAQSRYLRGRIAEELHDPCDHFSEPTALLLRQHGVYQQIDRDRHGQIGDPSFRNETVYQFMVRTMVPGGRLSSEQFLAFLALGDEFGGGRLKLTWRQNLELHHIAKRNLALALRRIHAVNLTTLGAGGDVVRNVITCPAPYRGDPVHGQMHALARELAAEFATRTSAYSDIWLSDRRSIVDAANAETTPITDDTTEPLYGPAYLPNKLKIAIGLPGDNCTDVYIHDIGLLAICENFNVVGYNVLVGGGTDVDDDTPPALGRLLGFVPANHVLDVVKAIVRVFRDFGNRANRQHSRLLHLIGQWGLEQFKAQVEACCGRPIDTPRGESVWNIDDHLGWHEQGDGRWFWGLHLPNGRVEDTHRERWKTALADICRKYAPPIYLTTGQSLLIGDVRWEDRPDVEDHLRRNGIRIDNDASSGRRWSTACVSLPSCPNALSESERALPGLLDQLEADLTRLGLQRELYSLRMSGCAHGCTRPYNADIGIIARGAGRYGILLGGRRLGDRIGFLYRDSVPLEQIPAVLVEVFAHFKLHRTPDEQLGDFCHRMGLERLPAE